MDPLARTTVKGKVDPGTTPSDRYIVFLITDLKSRYQEKAFLDKPHPADVRLDVWPGVRLDVQPGVWPYYQETVS